MANRISALLENEGINTYISPICSIMDKDRGVKNYVNYMLDRTNSMFEWEGLPDTIPQYMLELYLQIFGYAAFTYVDETNSIQYPDTSPQSPGIYIMYGGIGGERDIYYRPKLFTGANPRIKNSIQSTILYPGDTIVDNPTIIMPCDRNYMGLLPLYQRYAQQLVENDISIRSAQINARAQVAIETSTDRDRESARKYLDDLEAGKLGVLGNAAFLEGIKVANISTQSANLIIQLIELQQYLKASWFNELGLNVNFNMKREYMSEEEIAVNTDILLPLVDDMLNCRREYAEFINIVFGTNISVRKSSAWANKEQEELASISEASISGQVPLSADIKERIDNTDGQKGEVYETQVQSDVPEQDTESRSVETGREVEQGDNSEVETSGSEEDEEDINGVAPVVNINLEINTEGGEVEIGIEPSQEESEKSPTEPDIS